MIDKKLKSCFYVFILVLLTLPIYSNKSKADVVSVRSTGAGNFFPAENCSLSMTNASVTLSIEYPRSGALYERSLGLNHAYLNFQGNYTIFNPNESLNMTIVAPFSPDFKNLESTCEIKVEENVIPFIIVKYEYQNRWEDYLDDYYMGASYTRNFIVMNITFPENNSIEIESTFKAYIANTNSDGVLEIYYDVGTSRAWNGTITERVEFKAYGKIPGSYTGSEYWHEQNCTASDIEGGGSYVWEWKNERIKINSVFISYNTDSWGYFWGRMSIIILPSFFIVPFLILIISQRNKRRRNIPSI